MVVECILLLQDQSSNTNIWGLEEQRPTNEGRAIAVGKNMAHERLSIDASILIIGTSRCKNWLRNLEINQRGGS